MRCNAKKAATATDDCELLENEVRGIVKFFNIEKGYGFIDVGQTERDVFVHLHTLRNCGIHNLREGQNLLVDSAMKTKALRQQGCALSRIVAHLLDRPDNRPVKNIGTAALVACRFIVLAISFCL